MESQAVSSSKSIPVMPLGKKKRTKIHRARFKPYPMSDVAENVLLEKFSSSGRTGRRNALPDVMDKKYVGTSVANLPGQLDQLHLQIPSSEKLEKPNDTKDDKPSGPCASEKAPCASEKTEKDKATKSNVS